MALLATWPKASDQQIAALLLKLDSNGDGLLSKDEILKSSLAQGFAAGTIKKLEEVAPEEKPEETQ